MVKGGKRYSSMSNDGKWFAHSVLKENETHTRKTCTSTGIMLTQITSSMPQALLVERYPKWKTKQKSREYPLSDHDKYAFKDNISVFSHGVGLKKCPDERRQNNSHFCLCHGGADSNAEETRGMLSSYQTDFTAKAVVNVPDGHRLFHRNSQHQSAGAALAETQEQFMWFGQVNSGPNTTKSSHGTLHHKVDIYDNFRVI